MASFGFLTGGAIIDALAISGSNFLFSTLVFLFFLTTTCVTTIHNFRWCFAKVPCDGA